MSRIEDLPDDFDDSLNINDTSTIPSIGGLVSGDAVSPRGQDANIKTATETLKEWSKTPLFMNHLDVAEEAGMSR